MTVTTPAERTFTVIAFQDAREIDVPASSRVFVVPEDE
jgi:hypothetical protein